MITERTVATLAQYIADHIDASIYLKLTTGIDDERGDLAALLLETDGWHGRTYPPGFFRCPGLDTIA